MSHEEDRISVSKTVKVGLADYGSADVQVSYSSSAQENESIEDLYERVVLFVDSRLEQEEKVLKEKAEASHGNSEEETPKEEKTTTDKKSSGGTGLSRLKAKRSAAKEDTKEDNSEDGNKEEDYTEAEETSTKSEAKSRKVDAEIVDNKKDESEPVKAKSAKESVLAKYKLGGTKGKTSSLKR